MMRKIVFFACFLPTLTWATNTNMTYLDKVHGYQELCAKEKDPVKRHQYCQILNRPYLVHPRFEVFRQDIAIV